MLSIGAYAFDCQGNKLDAFRCNLHEREGAYPDPNTMEWWRREHPEEWKALLENRVNPNTATLRYYNWLSKLPGKPVVIGYPISCSWMFMYWYLMYYIKEDPLCSCGVDIGTACAIQKDISFGKKAQSDAERFEKKHNTLIDARAQAHIFLDTMKALKVSRFVPPTNNNRTKERKTP